MTTTEAEAEAAAAAGDGRVVGTVGVDEAAGPWFGGPSA